jgi:hypothetical protein
MEVADQLVMKKKHFKHADNAARSSIQCCSRTTREILAGVGKSERKWRQSPFTD